MFIAQATRTFTLVHRRAAVSGIKSAFRTSTTRSRAVAIDRSQTPQPHLTQTRPFFSWLLNPKEEPTIPKKLTPLKLDEPGNRLLFWDSTYTTPHLKPEFNESFHDDDSEEITDVHFVNQLANEEIVQIASGNFHNLALSKTGKMWSWGSGCLGRGDEIYDSLPQPVEFFHALGREIKQIFAAGNYSMALVRPKDGNDDELYIWGYVPFGDLDEHGDLVPVMRKCLRPVLVTSVLGYNISHVACSPWHFTLAATPLPASDSKDQSAAPDEKPLLMTFGRYSDEMPLEKPYSPLFMDLPLEDEFYDVKPWRIFRSMAPASDLVIKKMTASKGCDVILMENGSVGVSDHEDHVPRLIHRPLEEKILDVAGGSSEVIAVSSNGHVFSWSEPLLGQAEHGSEEHSINSTINTAVDPRSPVVLKPSNTRSHPNETNPENSQQHQKQSQPKLLPPPKTANLSSLHPLLNFNKDEQKAETEVLAFFDSQRRGHEQKQKTIRLVEALFDSPRLVVEKPGLSKCVAQYDRFVIC
ncbi:hypothetical protein FBU30_006899 [Linnemannia zychae]|nr:hypothetical protein FBU30_006899 [Linnemannia zychae]